MRRGEIYFVNLDPVVGREQAGRRPVLIVSDDEINRHPLVVMAVPGTAGANVPRDYRSTVRVPGTESGLPSETVFLCFQMRALDHTRFPAQPSGQLSGARMREVEEAIRYCLGM